MRLARAPLRVSLGGGGSDLPHFRYRFGGYVVSQAINRYVYVSVNPRYDGRIRVATTNDQIVDCPTKISHPIVREFFRLYGNKLSGGWDIHSSADIDGGSGLGSSGAFTVALMTAFLGHPHNRGTRAEEAYMLESAVSRCGPQDHYAATFGYCHAFSFPSTPHTEPPYCERLFSNSLLSRLMLFDTGVRRDADIALREVASADVGHLADIKLQGENVADMLRQSPNTTAYAQHMRRHWARKMQTQSVPAVAPDMLATAVAAGASAGKLVGAGGGGFMLFYVPGECTHRVRIALTKYKEIPLNPGDGAALLVDQ